MSRKNIYIFCCLLVLLCCRKEEDNIPPVLHFISPAENAGFAFNDTITVEVKAEDDKNLVSLLFNIVNSNGIPLGSTLSKSINASSFTWKFDIELSDYQLSGNEYNLWVRASDGVNEKNLYRPVSINIQNRELKSVVVVTASTSQYYDIFGFNENLTEVSFLTNVFGDFISSAVSSQVQIMYTAGKSFGDMKAFRFTDSSAVWTIPGENNPPFAYFTHIYFSNDQVYVGKYDSEISGYYPLGGANFYADINSGYFPEDMYGLNNYLITEEVHHNGTDHKIGVYYAISGLRKQSNYIGSSVELFAALDEDQVLVVGNQSGNINIHKYRVSANVVSSLMQISNDQVKSACLLEFPEILLAADNNLYVYNMESNSYFTWKANFSAEHIIYDAVNSIIYSGTQSMLKAYSYPAANLYGQYNLPDTILDIQLLYNY